VPIVLKSGSLNLLEPSGPVQANDGIALPLPLPLIHKCKWYFRVFHWLHMAWRFISTAGYFIRGHRVSDTDSVVQKHKKYLQARFTARSLNCNPGLEW